MDSLLNTLTGNVVPLEKLAEALAADGIPELASSVPQPYLRAYHYSQQDGELYFFVNEHPSSRVQTQITGAASGYTYVYDAFTNTLTSAANAFYLDLPPYGSRMVVISAAPLEAAPEEPAFVPVQRMPLAACAVALAPMETGCAEFGEEVSLDAPQYVSSLPGRETFAGRIRYRFTFALTAEQAARRARIVLEGVREGASVRVNGADCGAHICPDYCYRVSGSLTGGENTVEIELNTTLGRALNDFMSQFLPVEPTGLTGVTLELGGAQ